MLDKSLFTTIYPTVLYFGSSLITAHLFCGNSDHCQHSIDFSYMMIIRGFFQEVLVGSYALKSHYLVEDSLMQLQHLKIFAVHLRNFQTWYQRSIFINVLAQNLVSGNVSEYDGYFPCSISSWILTPKLFRYYLCIFNMKLYESLVNSTGRF